MYILQLFMADLFKCLNYLKKWGHTSESLTIALAQVILPASSLSYIDTIMANHDMDFLLGGSGIGGELERLEKRGGEYEHSVVLIY